MEGITVLVRGSSAGLLEPFFFKLMELKKSTFLSFLLIDLCDLVTAGSRESGTKISEYCCHALLTLEVLIHPRALPFIDLQSAVDHYGSASLNLPDVHFADHRKNTSFHFSTLGKEPSQPESGDDDLYERWLANGDETDVNDLGKYTSSDKESSGTSTHPAFEKLPHGDSPSERNEHEGGEFGASVCSICQ